MTSQEKLPKNYGLWILCGIILLIIIGILINYSKNSSINTVEQPINDIINGEKICEEKITNNFQLVEPEFSWAENPNIDENTLKGNVTYYEGDDIYEDTDFLCTISANTSDARIERDIDEDDYEEEEIIYDDREEGVDNTRAEVEARFQRDGHL